MDKPQALTRNEQPDAWHAFAELALIVVAAKPPEQTLLHLAELAKQTLGGVEEVFLTVIENGRPRSVVFTGPLAVHLDERQYELGFGPCLEAAKSGQILTVDSRQDGTPYREFARVADRAGIRHTISVGMPLAQRSIGGLNIYRTQAAPFSPTFLEHAEVFAGYAAVAVNNITNHGPVGVQAG